VFLVRESKSNPGAYVLTYKYSDKIFHAQIQPVSIPRLIDDQRRAKELVLRRLKVARKRFSGRSFNSDWKMASKLLVREKVAKEKRRAIEIEIYYDA